MPADVAPETRPDAVTSPASLHLVPALPNAAPAASRAQAGLIVAAIALVETGWLAALGFGAYKLFA